MKLFELFQQKRDAFHEIIDRTARDNRKGLSAQFTSDKVQITIKRGDVVQNFNLTFEEAEDLAKMLGEMMLDDYPTS